MRFVFTTSFGLKIFLLAALFFPFQLHAQSNVNVRVMAANLNGNTQSYQPFALRIFQGLKPDVVCIQEFNYSNNAASDFRSMLDTAFGTNFVYYREPFNSAGDIPNGIISRWPILAAGSWADAQQSQPNRGFAWAQIQLPGTNSLYVVSVHLLTSSASARSAEATALQSLIQSNLPTNAWVVLAGDFNTDSRTESTTMTTCDSYLSDFPVPVDNLGNSDTSQNRNHPHDYVLPSFAFTNFETATVLPSHSFPSGLVFDSTVYTPLSDVAPVQFGDSTNAQHMAVMKDFLIPATDNGNTSNAPAITTQPQSQTIATGSNVTFTVTASGTSPFAYQWLFNTTNILNATNNFYTIVNVQLTNAGNYSVIVTNIAGSATSSNAVLTVSNFPPSIGTQPQSQTVNLGDSATFNVNAGGTPPLNYQWLFNGTNLSGATTNSCAIANVQLTNTGNYSVIVSNVAGSVTSSVAVLSVFSTQTVVIAQWNFNSIVADGSTTSGTTAPSTGAGVASLVGTATATFATGDTNIDPAGGTDNSGWNTTTYPAQGTGNKTCGAQFKVSTAGKQNIGVSWSQQASKTGSKYTRLQYTTNGTDFVDFSTASSVALAANFEPKTISLGGISNVNDNTNFAIRILAEWESTAANTANANYVAANPGSSYAGTGTIRFDMVTITGTPTNAPAAAVLAAPTISGNAFGFTVSGSAGADYVVQVSTNLASTNWIPILTNTPPFVFADTNLSAQQKFYRAVSQ